MRRRVEFAAACVAALLVIADVAGAASSPAVVTGDSTAVTQTSATLHGSVNPNGSSTAYYFQLGPSDSYGFNGKPLSAGDGATAVDVKHSATNLVPGTTYHYRLVATNGYGTAAGADRTFTTAGHPPPGVATGAAESVDATGAILTGTIYPANQTTTWWVQWGTTPSFGEQTQQQTVAAGTSPEDVSASLEGLLAPGTIYYYRLVASHGSTPTTATGGTASFMTFPSPRPDASVRATTKPRVARHRPYVLATSGSVTQPAWMPEAYACSGTVMIRFVRGRKRVATTFAGLQPNCTYGAFTVFKRLPRARRGQRVVKLKALVTFLGNHSLAPAPRAVVDHVTLG